MPDGPTADDPDAGARWAVLEESLGHRFGRPDLLRQALTHSSAAHEAGDPLASNERLELLGDAVLGFLVTESLLRAGPQADEGVLSRWRASLIGAGHLSEVGARLELGRFLRLGKGEQRSGGREKASILADACEAVLGALYLDGGLTVVARFVARHWDAAIRRCVHGEPAEAIDPKSALQERLQARGAALPVYRLLDASGPDHQRRFRVEVSDTACVLGTGAGSSKQAAEQEAARQALRRLEQS